DGDRKESADDASSGLGHGERLDLELEVPRLEARQLQQVPDEVRHRADDAQAALEEVALDLRFGDLAAEDQLEVAAEARQRRAELVGNDRHEPRPFGLGGT